MKKKKSKIVNTFKFMYPNRKPFRDGKTGSRPTAAAAGYIIMVYRYITRIYASRQIAIFFLPTTHYYFVSFLNSLYNFTVT